MNSLCFEAPPAIFTGQRPLQSLELEAGVEKILHVEAISGDRSISESSMPTVPVYLADYLVDRFRAIANVRALMIGESDDVHHVWVLLDEWTPEHRKAIYSVQRDVLKKISGFNLDFYVVDIPLGTMPEDMVSGIPLVYLRN